MGNFFTKHAVLVLVLVVSLVFLSGCCMRLQSPVVFDGYYGGYSSFLGGGCGPSPCDPCGGYSASPCVPR